MFKKVVIATCLLLCTNAAYRGPLAGGLPASLYPAGVDPRTCPNFPECTNPAVAAIQNYPQYQTSPSYQNQIPYQPRHTSTPLLQRQTYYEPEFEFVPSSRRAQQQYTQPQYAQPQYTEAQYYNPPQHYAGNVRDRQYTPEEKRALDRGEYIGDGDYHGEGLVEALAPEYQGQQQSHRTLAPVGQYNTPAYQKVSEFLAQSQNVRPTPTETCRNYGHC